MTGTDAGQWETRHTGNSAPRLYHSGERSSMNASVAHSGNWVAVGVADGADIGVDIQTSGEHRNSQAIAEFLNLEKIAANDTDGFLRNWTLREAIAKSTGGSVLTKHAIESELGVACEQSGRVVRAADFSAMVNVIAADTCFAVVLSSHTEASLCA